MRSRRNMTDEAEDTTEDRSRENLILSLMNMRDFIKFEEGQLTC